MNVVSKIAYVQANSNIIAGQELSLMKTLKRLDRNFFYPVIILPDEGVFSDLLRENNIEVKIIKLSRLNKKNPFPYLLTIIKLFYFFKKNKISLVHTRGVFSNQYCSIAAKLARIPCICNICAVVYSLREIRKSFVILADKIIAISNAAKELICRSGVGQNKVTVIYNGIDIKKFNLNLIEENRIRTEFNIPKSIPIIGQVGQVIEGKGIKCFLEMAKIIKYDFKNVKFLLVGDDQHENGAYERKMKDYAKKLGLENNVIFTGFRNDIPHIMASLDIFVLASISEGLGNVFLEAMALQKPVVTTAVGGCLEIIEDGVTGFSIPYQDPQILADKVIFLLKNKNIAKKMGEKGRKWVLTHFVLNNTVEKIQFVYNQFITKING